MGPLVSVTSVLQRSQRWEQGKDLEDQEQNRELEDQEQNQELEDQEQNQEVQNLSIPQEAHSMLQLGHSGLGAGLRGLERAVGVVTRSSSCYYSGYFFS